MRKYIFEKREIIRYDGAYISGRSIKELENKYGRLLYVEYEGQRIKAL